jgi:hypothetical protein
LNPHTASFLKMIRRPLAFRLFLLSKLPAAYFSGVRVVSASEEQCVVRIPYKWLTRNPFRSTYFASLSMAAEMSTGVLALAQLYKRQPAVSMLVVKVESAYYKKATGRTNFTCTNGNDFKTAIEAAIATGESRTVSAVSEGVNAEGERVALFSITWSFKAKK